MNKFPKLLIKNNCFHILKDTSNCNRLTRPISTTHLNTRHYQANKHIFRHASNEILKQNATKYFQIYRVYSDVHKSSIPDEKPLTQLDFENYCAETLESLSDYFDELVESAKELESADVICKDGVLTVSFGDPFGTYVINKQTPNKQIWLSSPRSGPKRFDYVHSKVDTGEGYWIYKHTGVLLHELLDNEIGDIVNLKTEFQQLPFGSKD